MPRTANGNRSRRTNQMQTKSWLLTAFAHAIVTYGVNGMGTKKRNSSKIDLGVIDSAVRWRRAGDEIAFLLFFY